MADNNYKKGSGGGIWARLKDFVGGLVEISAAIGGTGIGLPIGAAIFIGGLIPAVAAAIVAGVVDTVAEALAARSGAPSAESPKLNNTTGINQEQRAAPVVLTKDEKRLYSEVNTLLRYVEYGSNKDRDVSVYIQQIEDLIKESNAKGITLPQYSKEKLSEKLSNACPSYSGPNIVSLLSVPAPESQRITSLEDKETYKAMAAAGDVIIKFENGCKEDVKHDAEFYSHQKDALVRVLDNLTKQNPTTEKVKIECEAKRDKLVSNINAAGALIKSSSNSQGASSVSSAAQVEAKEDKKEYVRPKF